MVNKKAEQKAVRSIRLGSSDEAFLRTLNPRNLTKAIEKCIQLVRVLRADTAPVLATSDDAPGRNGDGGAGMTDGDIF